jgi:hypothetical protein
MTANKNFTPRKRIKRKKGETPKSGMYFTPDTQKAICGYQASEDKKEKVELYIKEIMPAFEKLVENLINVYKFTSTYDSYDDLKNDCVNFLFETIGKFKADKGTNAFSYFNVVAKNWLIIKTKQRLNRLKRNVSMDDVDLLTEYDVELIEEHNLIPSQDDIVAKANEPRNVMELLCQIRNKMRTDSEKNAIESIIIVFEQINNLDLLSKNAVLTYLKDISGMNSKQLTTTLQLVKKQYRKVKADNLS